MGGGKGGGATREGGLKTYSPILFQNRPPPPPPFPDTLYTHTHTHIHSLSLFLSLSLTHTHTHTRTHTHTFRITCHKSAVRQLENGEERYIELRASNNNTHYIMGLCTPKERWYLGQVRLVETPQRLSMTNIKWEPIPEDMV